MRGLRPEEHEALTSAAKVCPGRALLREFSSGEAGILVDLMEQGRVRIALCDLHGDDCGVLYDATPAGREALRLWPLMQALEAQP